MGFEGAAGVAMLFCLSIGLKFGVMESCVDCRVTVNLPVEGNSVDGFGTVCL